MERLFSKWIVFISWVATFYYSILALLVPLTGKGKRQRTNNILCRWSNSLLNIIHLKYQVFNPHQVTFEPNKRYMVMCNHTSLYDIPLSILAVNNSLRMVAKKELARIPFFGQAMQANEFVFIDRKNREQAMKDLQKAADLMKSGIIIWMAPEGTRSSTGELLPFKKGGFLLALETGATIVPLGIRGALNIMPNKTLQVSQGKNVELHFGQPIDASQYTIEQRDQLIEHVRKNLSVAAGLIDF